MVGKVQSEAIPRACEGWPSPRVSSRAHTSPDRVRLRSRDCRRAGGCTARPRRVPWAARASRVACSPGLPRPGPLLRPTPAHPAPTPCPGPLLRPAPTPCPGPPCPCELAQGAGGLARLGESIGVSRAVFGLFWPFSGLIWLWEAVFGLLGRVRHPDGFPGSGPDLARIWPPAAALGSRLAGGRAPRHTHRN